jgi:large subunit ribosomal protein L6
LKLENLFKKQAVPYTKKLIFKGLGYKFSLSPDNKYLELKLGYSHLHRLLVPSQKIQLKLLKNAIVFSSKNLSLLGNFLFKIRQLRIPNSYKGKGIWYKNEKKKLKIIKKK